MCVFVCVGVCVRESVSFAASVDVEARKANYFPISYSPTTTTATVCSRVFNLSSLIEGLKLKGYTIAMHDFFPYRQSYFFSTK